MQLTKDKAESVSLLRSHPGWKVIREWLEEQIQNLTAELLNTGDFEKFKDLRIKVMAYKEILKKPEEIANAQKTGTET